MVGHVEWIEFARVERMPPAGQIVHAEEVWEEPGGGGAVAAVQLAKLAGGAIFFTALGDDERGHRAHDSLVALGVEVHAAWRSEPQRRGFVHVDGEAERTITVIGERAGPARVDDLPWERLADADAVYLTAGDAGAVRAARNAATMVATARGLGELGAAGVHLDALVASAEDVAERYERGDLSREPDVVLRTAGADGGSWERRDETEGGWCAASLLGEPHDAYGCGDSFAGGLTFALGAGRSLEEAVEFGSRCGAACLTGRGPYSAQLTAADL